MSQVTDYILPPEGRAYKENVPDTRESPVREMLTELKEFGIKIYGYDPLLSKEEILERFSFSTNLFFQTLGKFDQNASRKKSFTKRIYSFLAQVLSRRKKVFCKKKKCVDVRGMFNGEEARNKGFYYKRL